jgi:2-keto-4-pentenoate hydratase/2-oxohepta-3-ene-1,7-dioic acid hydratase in catechol pathway
MKLVTFVDASGLDCLGVLHPEDEQRVIDLRQEAAIAPISLRNAALRPGALDSLQQFIEAGDAALALAREIVASTSPDAAQLLSASGLKLRAPIPQPVQFRDCLLFEEHLVNSFAALRQTLADQAPDPVAALQEFEARGLYRVPQVWYEMPVYYKVNRFSFIGPGDQIVWPSYTERLDYELEYACVLSRKLKDATLEEAESAIFGYTIFNDVSARDIQSREMQAQLGPAKGKDFDTGNIIGPCIVTKDAFDPRNARMSARINGQLVCEGNTGTARWSFPQVIVHASRSETLMPGEFFGSGTVGGGCALENGRFLAPGDVIEFEVEGIGILRNTVVRHH